MTADLDYQMNQLKRRTDTCSLRYARENKRRASVTINFSFGSDLLKLSRKVLQPIVKLCNAHLNSKEITCDDTIHLLPRKFLVMGELHTIFLEVSLNTSEQELIADAGPGGKLCTFSKPRS